MVTKPTFMQRLGKVFRLGNWMGSPQTGYLPGSDGKEPVNSAFYVGTNNLVSSNRRYVPASNTSRPGQYVGTDPEEQEAARQIIKVDTLGAPGTQIFAGYIHEDYLHNLQGHQRADIFDQMRRSDAQVAMCLSASKNPILAGTCEIEPADDSDEQKMYAEFMKHLLFEAMEEPWTQFLTEALTCIEFGYSLFELTDKVVTGHPKWGDYNAIKQLGWRSPRSIHRFNCEPKNGRLLSVSQYVYGDMARVVDIPAEYLLLFTLNREGANYEGISFLRKIYGNWFRKEHYLRMNAIGIEKFAVPTPIVDIPPGAQGTDQFPTLIEVLEAYTQHESNYITKPQGWTLTFPTNVYDPSKVEDSINSEDTRMVKGFCANFLELGLSGKGGAYALSQDLSDFFVQGLKSITQVLCDGINQVVIPRMIKMNFGPQLVYPKLKISGVDDQPGQEFGMMLKQLADSQYITPDDQLEEHIRKRLFLPKMSLTGQRAVKAVGAAGTAGPANPSFTQLAETIGRIGRKRFDALLLAEQERISGEK